MPLFKKARTSNNERLFIYLSAAKSDDEINAAFINSNEAEKHMPASRQTIAGKRLNKQTRKIAECNWADKTTTAKAKQASVDGRHFATHSFKLYNARQNIDSGIPSPRRHHRN